MSRVTEQKRVRRTPINGKRNILTVEGKDPRFVYRIVNDTGDRIAQFQEAGYEIVSDANVKIGDRRVAVPTQEGAPVQVSVGGGQKAFLMRILKEFYDEDQAAKLSAITELEATMKKEAREAADFGKLSIS